jgi:acyl carrier protein
MSMHTATAQDIMDKCAGFIAEQLRCPIEDVASDVEFDDFGLDSALVTSMLIELEEWLGVELSPSLVFEEPTLRRLGNAVSRQLVAA